jgi:hypothetical protein
MSDIWSGIGVEISEAEGQWLYRRGGEVHGPVSQKVVVDKLLKGEILPTTPIAKEGGDFHPIAQVKVFLPHVQQAKEMAAKRSAAKSRRIIFLVLLLVLAGGAAAGYFVWEAHEKRVAAAERERKAKLAQLEADRAKRQASGNLDLVALVSIGSEEEVTFRGRPPRRKIRPGKRDSKAPKEDYSQFAVQSCERSAGSIVGALGKHVSKLSVCVEEEKKRDQSGMMPAKLNIEFVVTAEGKVTEFAIDNRHYRTGIMKNCMTKVFRTVRYPPSTGSNCPVTLPLNIGK